MKKKDDYISIPKRAKGQIETFEYQLFDKSPNYLLKNGPVKFASNLLEDPKIKEIEKCRTDQEVTKVIKKVDFFKMEQSSMENVPNESTSQLKEYNAENIFNFYSFIKEENELSWKEVSINDELSPKVLICGDIETECYQNLTLDVALPKFNLLLNICSALKLESHEAIFSNFLEEGTTNFLESSQLSHFISKYSPQYILLLGATSLRYFGYVDKRLASIHGKKLVKEIKNTNGKIQSLSLIPLFHPEYLLINPNMKRTVWNDLKQIIESL